MDYVMLLELDNSLFPWQRNGNATLKKCVIDELQKQFLIGNQTQYASSLNCRNNGTHRRKVGEKRISRLSRHFCGKGLWQPWRETKLYNAAISKVSRFTPLYPKIIVSDLFQHSNYIPLSCCSTKMLICPSIQFLASEICVIRIGGRGGFLNLWVDRFSTEVFCPSLLIFCFSTEVFCPSLLSLVATKRQGEADIADDFFHKIDYRRHTPHIFEKSNHEFRYSFKPDFQRPAIPFRSFYRMAEVLRLLGNKKEDRPFSMTGKDLELRHLNTMAWFHGKLSRDEAEKLLKPREDGLFLVRESSNFTGDYTLCVCYQRKVEHYRVISKDGKLTIDEEEFFYHLTDLVEHYENDSDGLCTQLMRPVTKNGSKVLQGGGDGWSQGTEVVARYAFPGTSSVDLPFAKRERLTIVHTTNTPDWIRARNHSGSEGLIPTAYINTDKKEVKLESMMWFHGKISRNEAEQLLTPRSEGLFLVRESSNFTGDYTLCVCYQGMVEHYRIVNNYGKLTIDKEEYFDHLTNLVEHYGNDADGLCTQLVRSVTKQGRRHLQATSLEHLDMEDENMYGNMGYNKRDLNEEPRFPLFSNVAYQH
ncbi:unnamed protein product, partial [Meganyctiphanes norvegica]